MQSFTCVPIRQAISGLTSFRVCKLLVSLAVLSGSASAQVGVKDWGWQVFDWGLNSGGQTVMPLLTTGVNFSDAQHIVFAP